MGRYIAPLFLIAILIGWFMPTGDPALVSEQQSVPAHVPPPQPPRTSAPMAPLTQPQVAQPQNSAPQQSVVLKREGNGHFFANGEADGAPMRFMVDTGASVIALTAADAQKLGQTWYPNELQVIGRGASGDVIGKPIMLRRLRVGNFEAQNVQAVIVPEGLDVSLLGQSFLSKVPNVNISGDQMTLG
jgi:aspartyl protease family protein